jgi:tetratricopeptide (TPR) repeat protein
VIGPASWRWRFDLPAAAVVVAVTLALFSPVRHDAFINFDDPEYVTGNPHVLGGLSAANAAWAFSDGTYAYWHPLTWLTLQADVSLWGVRPGTMALENAVLHAIGAAVWYLVWTRATARRWRALVVALLFAVHPTRVESVAWIAERKDVLAGTLAAAVVLAHVNFAAGAPRRRGWYATALAAYVLAAMAKPMVVTLPILLLLLDWWPLGRFAAPADHRGPAPSKQGRRKQDAPRPALETRLRAVRILIEKAPFALIAAAGVVMTLLSKGQADAVPTLEQLGIWKRAATTTVGYCRYLGELVAPVRLSIFYPYNHDLPVRLVAAAAIFLAAVTWLAWRARRRRPYLPFGWCWLLVSLLPVIGIVQSGMQSLGDRFVYTAAIGPFVAVVWSVAEAVDRMVQSGRRWARPAGGILAAAALAVFAALTVRYLPAWRDSVAVWTWAQRSVNPPGGEIEAHLGEAWLEAGQPTRAIEPYMAALEADPDNIHIQTGVGDTLMRLQPQKAVEYYSQACEHAPDNAVLHFRYGFALAVTGHRNQAAAEFRIALRLDPDDTLAKEALERLNKQG